MTGSRPRRPAVAARALVAAGMASLCSAGCGYRPARDLDPQGRTFALAAGPVHVADAAAVGALEAGARAELARRGALSDCAPARDDTCAAIVIELLGLEDVTTGISSAAGAPIGAGSRMTAVGRATVFEGDRRDEIGETRASEVVAAPDAAPADVLVRREAARRASRRLGERLIRRALGAPEPAADAW